MKVRALQLLLGFLIVSGQALAHDVNKVQDNSWWWSDTWWKNGIIKNNRNYKVKTRWISYKNGDIEVNAMLVQPVKRGRYPAVLFSHGRAGLNDLVKLKVRRLAARGLIVLAPDIYGSRLLDALPYKHDYALEEDVNKGVDALLKLPEVKAKKICLVSHTRGGYYTLKVAVTKGRQNKEVACYVSWYPHMQDPNAPEPSQVYGYAPEADKLKIPVLIFVGENEQYQRRRPIETATRELKAAGRDVTLIVYPGVGRGFDFRPERVRTFADEDGIRDFNRA